MGRQPTPLCIPYPASRGSEHPLFSFQPDLRLAADLPLHLWGEERARGFGLGRKHSLSFFLSSAVICCQAWGSPSTVVMEPGSPFADSQARIQGTLLGVFASEIHFPVVQKPLSLCWFWERMWNWCVYTRVCSM